MRQDRGRPGRPSLACEAIHDLLTFGEPVAGEISCVEGQTFCEIDEQGNIIQPCVTCAVQSELQLCWASECRGFNGDTGQFGQFKKAGRGELEAIIMVIANQRTGQSVTLVDQVDNPDCAADIPAPTGNPTCTALYKVKGIRPIGGGLGPLCTWNDLDDVNTITRTPLSDGIVLTDLNGRQCEARRRAGDQYWLFYQTCCAPVSEFGSPGDPLVTTTTLVYDDDGVCSVRPVRPGQDEAEPIPTQPSGPCL